MNIAIVKDYSKENSQGLYVYIGSTATQQFSHANGRSITSKNGEIFITQSHKQPAGGFLKTPTASDLIAINNDRTRWAYISSIEFIAQRIYG